MILPQRTRGLDATHAVCGLIFTTGASDTAAIIDHTSIQGACSRFMCDAPSSQLSLLQLLAFARHTCSCSLVYDENQDCCMEYGNERPKMNAKKLSIS